MRVLCCLIRRPGEFTGYVWTQCWASESEHHAAETQARQGNARNTGDRAEERIFFLIQSEHLKWCTVTAETRCACVYVCVCVCVCNPPSRLPDSDTTLAHTLNHIMPLTNDVSVRNDGFCLLGNKSKGVPGFNNVKNLVYQISTDAQNLWNIQKAYKHTLKAQFLSQNEI